MRQRPSEPERDGASQGGGNRHLQERAGHRDPLHREKILGREMQADAEHQQDHADIGKLERQLGIGDEAWRERPDGDACKDVARQRRQAQQVGERAEDEGETEAED